MMCLTAPLGSRVMPGEKSVDVSKVFKNFDVDNIASGFVGGFSCRELEVGC